MSDYTTDGKPAYVFEQWKDGPCYIAMGYSGEPVEFSIRVGGLWGRRNTWPTRMGFRDKADAEYWLVLNCDYGSATSGWNDHE